jgi:hypothetical protein
MHKRKIYSKHCLLLHYFRAIYLCRHRKYCQCLQQNIVRQLHIINGCPNNSAPGCGWGEGNACSIYKFRFYDTSDFYDTSEWYREETRNQLLRIILMSQTSDNNKRISKNTLLLYSHRLFPTSFLCFYNLYRELTYSY